MSITNNQVKNMYLNTRVANVLPADMIYVDEKIGIVKKISLLFKYCSTGDLSTKCKCSGQMKIHVPLPFIKEKYKTLDKLTSFIMFYRQ